VGRADRQRVELKSGEHGVILSLFVKNADGTAYTSFAGTETVTFYVLKEGGTAVAVGTGHVHATGTGEVQVVIGSGDVAKLPAGLYLAEVEVTAAGSELITQDCELLVSRRIGS
jgi:hypothetical protein